MSEWLSVQVEGWLWTWHEWANNPLIDPKPKMFEGCYRMADFIAKQIRENHAEVLAEMGGEREWLCRDFMVLFERDSSLSACSTHSDCGWVWIVKE